MTLSLKSCPNYGRPVPPDAPANLCPSCLVKGGFSQNELCGNFEAHSSSTLYLVFPVGAPVPT